MNPDALKAIARRYVEEALNQGDERAADALVAEDFDDHDPLPQQGSGLEGRKRRVRLLRQAFLDWQVTIDDLLAEGDCVVWRFTATGTHGDAFLGVPATGKRVRYTGITMFRVRDGKLREHWVVFDRLGLLHQLRSIG